MDFENIKVKFPGVRITANGFFGTSDGSEGHQV